MARKRLETRWTYQFKGETVEFRQPEDYGYDFRGLVSPYSKTAGNIRSDLMLVLQDWASHDKLSGAFNPLIQTHGHDPNLRTNIVLKNLLRRKLNRALQDVYGTNVFPFIKAGNISAPIPKSYYLYAAQEFTIHEVEAVAPRFLLTLGRASTAALIPFEVRLRGAGCRIFHLPHPAARISRVRMDEAWSELEREMTA
ncbi:uracil-DNA glycosylase family protein [Euryhalocaulis caribicus]|uniref:uracil-DNA glycosylase family protein n=1 Tax=Euryhalocaulis caribicus TaxID=1161401 RepID=UPI0003B61B62|nr:uracil-DNA glycosylase family protein [Euryhalocaulis caribicus]